MRTEGRLTPGFQPEPTGMKGQVGVGWRRVRPEGLQSLPGSMRMSDTLLDPGSGVGEAIGTYGGAHST